MGLDNKTLAVAKSYVKQSMQGAGAVKGQPGKDGNDGDDGYSPKVEVKTNTDSQYILTITDKNGSYDTPNLKGADGIDGTGNGQSSDIITNTNYITGNSKENPFIWNDHEIGVYIFDTHYIYVKATSDDTYNYSSPNIQTCDGVLIITAPVTEESIEDTHLGYFRDDQFRSKIVKYSPGSAIAGKIWFMPLPAGGLKYTPLLASSNGFVGYNAPIFAALKSNATADWYDSRENNGEYLATIEYVKKHSGGNGYFVSLTDFANTYQEKYHAPMYEHTFGQIVHYLMYEDYAKQGVYMTGLIHTNDTKVPNQQMNYVIYVLVKNENYQTVFIEGYDMDSPTKRYFTVMTRQNPFGINDWADYKWEAYATQEYVNEHMGDSNSINMKVVDTGDKSTLIDIDESFPTDGKNSYIIRGSFVDTTILMLDQEPVHVQRLGTQLFVTTMNGKIFTFVKNSSTNIWSQYGNTKSFLTANDVLALNNIDPFTPTKNYHPATKKYVDDKLSGTGTKGDTGSSAYDIAVENGFTGTEEEWLASLKGDDGLTPTIAANGNWFIGTTDTGVVAKGKDGKSIQSITSNENNHIIVTFTDGSTQDIGELSVDVSADFLKETGFGNLRYYNGKFQKFQNGEWVDTAITPSNVMPNPMQKIVGIYDHNIGHYKLRWLEPEDTVINGQVVCVVDKVIIRRKQNAVPQNENDGDLVMEIPKSGFGQHNTQWYEDESISPSIGDVYYYKAFTVSSMMAVNAETANETGALTAKDHFLFSFTINQETEANPAKMVYYADDNVKFASAFMDYVADKFNYGDWKDFWFMNVKPCMLKYDGTVDYYLNPNDYTKKVDGTDSDNANTAYEGNCMIQLPKIYYKIFTTQDGTSGYHISDKNIDGTYKLYSFINCLGEEIDYCYLPAYPGSMVDGVLRSISGLDPIAGKTRLQEIDAALANNLDENQIWNTEVLCDHQLINILLLLIGKSTDTQTTFGSGNNNSYVSTSNTGVKKTGTMDNKGVFWGDKGNETGVKVFGMEHYWGNQYRAIAGWINDKGTQKIKLTYGTQEGSSSTGYNTTGAGYIAIQDATPSSINGGYISSVNFEEYGIIPKVASGSATTKYCDGLWFNYAKVYYALVGGDSSDGLHVGAFCSILADEASNTYWGFGASLSCKPLA